MADRQRREFLPRLPLGGERRRPAGIAVEIPFVVGERERAVRAALEQEVAADPQHEKIHVAVAVDVDRIGADDILEQFGIGADIERLLFEPERAARARTVDEEPRRIFAARQEHRGKAGPIAVQRRAAAADEELPRTVVDAVDARRLGLLVHDGDVAERLCRSSAARAAPTPSEEGENASDDPHHGASMTSDRRKATTLVALWDQARDRRHARSARRRRARR